MSIFLHTKKTNKYRKRNLINIKKKLNNLLFFKLKFK